VSSPMSAVANPPLTARAAAGGRPGMSGKMDSRPRPRPAGRLARPAGGGHGVRSGLATSVSPKPSVPPVPGSTNAVAATVVAPATEPVPLPVAALVMVTVPVAVPVGLATRRPPAFTLLVVAVAVDPEVRL